MEDFAQLFASSHGAFTETFSFEIKTPAEAQLELQLAALSQQFTEIQQRVSHIEDCGQPCVVVLTDLHPFDYDASRPIYITVEPDGAEFLATFTDANISASGETQGDAVENVKDLIVAHFEDLSSEPVGRLGPGPTHQLAVLKRFLIPRT
jgi:predicted RNase H-like HicB family nuclease